MFYETEVEIASLCESIKCITECAIIVIQALKDIGVIKINAQNADELGAKILEAEVQGITLESSNNFEDWSNKVNKVEVPNPEKYSPEDKDKKAIEYAIGCISNKYDVALSVEAANSFLKHIDYFKNNGKLDYIMKNDSDVNTSLVEYGNYFDSKIVGAEADNIREKLIDLEMSVNPNISRQEAIDNIYKHKS